ncbi:MAG: hypothetical protein Greene041662_13 [Candidatus Peregrinibacteria bacterium Greene0416_62]|nr:MAG: hypothetical protein Greene041662_13 [Candidatus Peregrinibacteria bacterium Greene0416_62]TSC99761.1 MAG: hypothetical protein Greene101449_538 [Candidatus Peregrinibacteria bacterium Greene1014_49]
MFGVYFCAMSELDTVKAEVDERMETLEEVSRELNDLMDKFPLDAIVIRWEFSDAGRFQDSSMDHCIQIGSRIGIVGTPETEQISGYREIRTTYDEMLSQQRRVLQAMRDLCLGESN